MIEVIYKEEQAEQDGAQETFAMPRNVRQIGLANGNYRIYVEDYVDTFFLQLSEKSEKEKQPEGAFLIGEMQKQDNEEYIYIYGAIKIKELKKEGGEV